MDISDEALKQVGEAIQDAWDKTDVLPAIDLTRYERNRLARAAIEAYLATPDPGIPVYRVNDGGDT